MDDVPLVQSVDTDGKTADPIIDGLRAPWWYFGERYWAGTDSRTSPLYRPVTILTFALTYNLVCAPLLPRDWEAFPHHLINVLLHCFAVWLVWWMLGDLARGELLSLVGATLFAFHALHSEVIAGLVGRAELLSFVFGLWATLLFVRGLVFPAGMLFFFAFCAKESALAWAPFLPCYILVRHWLRDGGARIGAVLAPHARALGLALGSALAVFLTLRWLVVVDLFSVFSYDQNPLAFVDTGTRLMTAIKLLGYGLYLCIAPFELYCIYGPGVFEMVDSPGDSGFLAAFAVLLAWLVAGIWLARRSPLLFLSVAAFLGFSFITSNVPFAIGTIFGERLFYMPSLGVCVLPVVATAHLGARGRRVLLVALVAWCVANCTVILQRNAAFDSSVSLFVGDAERLPESADLQAKAGYMYWTNHDDLGLSATEGEAKALEYLTKSVERDEDFAGSWASIARIYGVRGRRDLAAGRQADGKRELQDAAKFYRRALDTRYIHASGVENRTIEDYLAVLLDLQRDDEALAFARDVIQRKPKHHFSRLVLVDHGAKRITPDERVRLLAAGLQHWPNDPYFTLLRAMTVYEAGQRTRNADTRIAHEINESLKSIVPRLLSPETRLRSRLYLGDVLGALGQRQQALQVLEPLLAEKSLTGAARTQLERQIAELKNKKR